MTLRTLSFWAFTYGILATIWGLIMLVKPMISNSLAELDYNVLTYRLILIFHGIAQAIYARRTMGRLDLPYFETLDTLDNELIFQAENRRVYRNPLWMIALAVFATVIELVLAYLSVMWVRNLSAYFEFAPHLAVLCLICLAGTLPSMLYNLRTWNMQRVMVNEDIDTPNDV